MSEITDLVLPVLQRIQADVAEIKRVQAEHGRALKEHSAKFEEIEIYTAYETGLGAQNKMDLKLLRTRIKAVEDRLATLPPPA